MTKIKELAAKAKSFMKDHWIDILVAIISALFGAVLESFLDSLKTKTYIYGEKFDGPATDDNLTAGYKIRMDVKGNKIMRAGVKKAMFTAENPHTPTRHESYMYGIDSCDPVAMVDFFDFDYNND